MTHPDKETVIVIICCIMICVLGVVLIWAMFKAPCGIYSFSDRPPARCFNYFIQGQHYEK